MSSGNFTCKNFVISLIENNTKEMLERMSRKTKFFWIFVMNKNGIILTDEDVDFIKQKLAEHVEEVHHKMFEIKKY